MTPRRRTPQQRLRPLPLQTAQTWLAKELFLARTALQPMDM